MAAALEPLDDRSELLDQVELWRAQRFLALGLTARDAVELARTTVDLHRFQDLVGRGCPPDLAARILR